MLLNTTAEFDDACLKSHHYLNDPKCILNGFMDAIYRQLKNEEEFLNCVIPVLKKYKFTTPKELATKFYRWRDSISMKTFDEMNINSYVDNPPLKVKVMDNHINQWFKTNTREDWRYGVLVSSTTLNYNFKDLWN